jgi:cell division protein ZapA
LIKRILEEMIIVDDFNKKIKKEISEYNFKFLNESEKIDEIYIYENNEWNINNNDFKKFNEEIIENDEEIIKEKEEEIIKEEEEKEKEEEEEEKEEKLKINNKEKMEMIKYSIMNGSKNKIKEYLKYYNKIEKNQSLILKKFNKDINKIQIHPFYFNYNFKKEIEIYDDGLILKNETVFFFK